MAVGCDGVDQGNLGRALYHLRTAHHGIHRFTGTSFSLSCFQSGYRYDTQHVSLLFYTLVGTLTHLLLYLSQLRSEAARLAHSTTPSALHPTLRQALLSVQPVSVESPARVRALAILQEAYATQSRAIRAQAAAWQSRIARGLPISDATKDADLDTFDRTTQSVLAVAPAERAARRAQLQERLQAARQKAWSGHVTNLEKATLKRFQTALLKTLPAAGAPPTAAESILTQQAAALRKEALYFETRLGTSGPAGMVDVAKRDLAAKLNDAWQAFPDSPAAKLQRLASVSRVVNREREPGRERSVQFGLDLVAMIRPDGFGSLQGFAGYQLPGGNSITLGVHNDADDPQVIAQFGGVRPPLLRVQPKLRVDVEL